MAIKGMTVGSRGGKLSLLLGVGLGVVAAALIVVYLSGAKGEGGGGSISGPSESVVVASQNIPAGTRITAEMVAVKKLPDSTVLTGAFKAPEAVVGQVTTVPVIAGEQLVPEKITATGQAAVNQYGDNPPLSLLLEPGQRAVSVELSSLIGAGGLIRPGDHVDVILSVKTMTSDEATGDGSNPGGSNQVAVTILQDLKVLAVDQNVAAQAAGGDDTASDTAEDENAAATTVTFAATPTQAEVLALADMCRSNFNGRLAISLRGFGDVTKTVRTEWPADGAPPDCATLLGVKDLR
ncbi:MAG TPA: Flp pilus assembly protein CpaB [Dehalococcoidia bacterium]|nr:Flp pilus assembly protein CpaB [Dehalococcoidia bacterium]